MATIMRLVSQTKLSKNVQFLHLRSVLGATAPFCSVPDDENQISKAPSIKKTKTRTDTPSHENLDSEALQLFRQLNKKNEPEDGFFLKGPTIRSVESYEAMVKILSYYSRLLEFESKKEHLDKDLLDEFVDLGAQVFPVEYSRLVLVARAVESTVKSFVSLGMYNEAMDNLFHWSSCGFPISISSCNLLMDQLVKCGEFDKALNIYNNLGDEEGLVGVAPNGETYGIVVKAFCRKHNLDGAAAVLEEMDEAGVLPDVSTYIVLLEELCSHGKSCQAYKLLRKIRREKAEKGENEPPIDAMAYMVVLRGSLKEKKLYQSLDVVRDMQRRGLSVDEDCYSAMMNVYCESGDMKEALNFCNEMKLKNVKISATVITSQVLALCRNGRFDKAVELFKSGQESIEELGIDNSVYSAAMLALCKLGRSEESLKLLDEMKDKGMAPDVSNYSTLITGCFVAGRVSDAFKLIKEMEENGMKPIHDAYNHDFLAAAAADGLPEMDV